MKRLFTAVKFHPDKDFLDTYRKIRSALKYESIKWVEEYNIHVTVKFLGDTEEKRIPELGSVFSRCAETMAPFQIGFTKPGIFGSSYVPRVVWVGIEPYAKLTELMRLVQSELVPLGYAIDRQNLVPHLTLGRIKTLKDRIAFQKVINGIPYFTEKTIQVEEMILFESILKKEGPEYVIIDRFPFTSVISNHNMKKNPPAKNHRGTDRRAKGDLNFL
jgi:2'-5' RNA ligase